MNSSKSQTATLSEVIFFFFLNMFSLTRTLKTQVWQVPLSIRKGLKSFESFEWTILFIVSYYTYSENRKVVPDSRTLAVQTVRR